MAHKRRKYRKKNSLPHFPSLSQACRCVRTFVPPQWFEAKKKSPESSGFFFPRSLFVPKEHAHRRRICCFASSATILVQWNEFLWSRVPFSNFPSVQRQLRFGRLRVPWYWWKFSWLCLCASSSFYSVVDKNIILSGCFFRSGIFI